MLAIEIVTFFFAVSLTISLVTKNTLSQAVFTKLSFDTLATVTYFSMRSHAQAYYTYICLLLVFLGTGLSILLLCQLNQKQENEET